MRQVALSEEGEVKTLFPLFRPGAAWRRSSSLLVWPNIDRRGLHESLEAANKSSLQRLQHTNSPRC